MTWNNKELETNKDLQKEITEADNSSPRKNLRARMAVLQAIPMLTDAIQSDGSLLEWVTPQAGADDVYFFISHSPRATFVMAEAMPHSPSPMTAPQMNPLSPK